MKNGRHRGVGLYRLVGLVLHVRRAFLGCPSKLDESPEGLASSCETSPASGRDEGGFNRRKPRVLLSPCSEICRESCPRFQAMRESLTMTVEQVQRDDLLIAPRYRESNLRDRDRNKPEIHDLDANSRHSALLNVAERHNSNTDTVTVETPPCVEDAEHSTEKTKRDSGDSRGEGNGLFVEGDVHLLSPNASGQGRRLSDSVEEDGAFAGVPCSVWLNQAAARRRSSRDEGWPWRMGWEFGDGARGGKTGGACLTRTNPPGGAAKASPSFPIPRR